MAGGRAGGVPVEIPRFVEGQGGEVSAGGPCDSHADTHHSTVSAPPCGISLPHCGAAGIPYPQLQGRPRMRRILLLGISALLVVGSSGCGGDGTDTAAGPDDTLPPSPTPQIGLSVAPDPAYAGYTVTLSVTVSSLYAAVKTVSVDFTNDGVVDEVRTFNQRRVTTVFNPTYDAAGAHAARAEAT